MVMRPFHTLLKYATKHIRYYGRRIFPTNLLKLISLGYNITVRNLAPPNKPNMCIIAVFNGRCRNTCNLEHQKIIYAHTNDLLRQVGKGISVITEVLRQ